MKFRCSYAALLICRETWWWWGRGRGHCWTPPAPPPLGPTAPRSTEISSISVKRCCTALRSAMKKFPMIFRDCGDPADGPPNHPNHPNHLATSQPTKSRFETCSRRLRLKKAQWSVIRCLKYGSGS